MKRDANVDKMTKWLATEFGQCNQKRRVLLFVKLFQQSTPQKSMHTKPHGNNTEEVCGHPWAESRYCLKK